MEESDSDDDDDAEDDAYMSDADSLRFPSSPENDDSDDDDISGHNRPLKKHYLSRSSSIASDTGYFQSATHQLNDAVASVEHDFYQMSGRAVNDSYDFWSQYGG